MASRDIQDENGASPMAETVEGMMTWVSLVRENALEPMACKPSFNKTSERLTHSSNALLPMVRRAAGNVMAFKL